MVATIATSVGASVGVSVQQMLEPFAMIGPDGNSTLDEIAWLTKYWTHPESLPFAKVIDADAITVDAPAASIAQDDVDFGIVSYVPFVDFDGLIESQPNPANPLASSAEIGSHLSIQSNELSRIDWQSHDDDGFRVVGSEDVIRMQQDTPGLQEPNDVAQIGQKAEVSLAKDALAVGPAAVSDQPREADSREKIGINSAKDAPRRLVGSSGFVATIEQVLLPYEFATQTQLRRNLFPLQSGAYCVVERVTLEGLQPEESTESDVALDAGVEEPFDDSSPAMDEVISKIRLALEQKPQWRRWVRVKNYGRYLGRFASLANGSASVVTRKLASEWPEASIANETAGEKLLTRAGAFVEDGEPIPSQIDQVRIDQFRQTVESWYQATVSMQEWFRVAQRHANESDDGRNRSKRLR